MFVCFCVHTRARIYQFVHGWQVASEHEDECFATVELVSEGAKGLQAEIETALLKEAKAAEGVGKGSVPEHVRFDAVPKNFKGATLVPQLLKATQEWHAANKASCQ